MSVFDKKGFVSGEVLIIGLMTWILILVWPMIAVAQEVKDCLECHPTYYGNLRGKFNHSPFEEEDCYACHKFHGFRNASELNGAVRGICNECHAEIAEIGDDFVHDPIADEDASCTNCHDPHSSDSSGLLSQPVKAICIDCHESPDEATGVVHSPYADTSCVHCHNPHGSPFGANHQMPIEYVCLECHIDAIGDLEPTRIHAADEDQSCDKCHYGHQSPHDALLRIEPERLCLECHSSLRAELDSKPRHTILEEDDCLVCHRPHFEKSGTHLISDQKELCFTCHAEIEELVQSGGTHEAAKDDCTGCHDPHLKLPSDIQPELCGDCHDMEDESFSDSHFGLTPEICSECHNPHGSTEKKLIHPIMHGPFAEKECEICHDQGQADDRLKQNDLCLDCHDIGGQDGSHSTTDIMEKTCIFCHSPHASSKGKLLRSGI